MSLSLIWMGALLVVWAGLFGGAFLRPRDTTGHRDRRLLLASSAVLTIAAWSTFFLVRETGVSPFAFLIAVGMSFGFLGDLWMGHVLPAPNRLVAGMASFGLGHLFYIAAAMLMYRLGLSSAAQFFGAWFIWLLMAVAGWYAFIYRGQRATVLHWISLPYGLLLSSTAGFATGLALGAPDSFISFACGAALFVVSDFLIALREFVGRRDRLILDGVWLTYGPAQMLIVYTTWVALL